MSYTIEIPGVPPRKNRRHVLVGKGRFPRLVNSPEFKAFCGAVKCSWEAAGHPRIDSGTWSLCVRSAWPRQRHLDVDVPLGDVDAPVSAVLDALQEAGILDDDARVLELQANKAYCTTPSTRITLSEICRVC